jgi:uncharacterized protein
MTDFGILWLLSALGLGLLSSLHCVGMCGPLVLALPIQGVSPQRRTGLSLVYHLGRSLTYSVMGTLMGALGLSVVLFGYQQQLSIGAGVLMLLIWTLYMVGRLPRFQALQQRVHRLLAKLWGQKPRLNVLFTMGALNGLLPCGVVYLALVGAVGTGSIFGGALYMFLFGLGTAPLLITLGLLGTQVSFLRRHQYVLRYGTAVLALILILRGMNLGLPYLSPRVDPQQGLPACCHKPVVVRE